MRVLMMTWACDGEDVSEPEIGYKWVREISKDHDVTLFAVSKADRYGCVKKQFPDIKVIEWKDVVLPNFLERFQALAKPGYIPYFFRARAFLKAHFKEVRYDVIHHITPLAWRYPSPAAGLGVPLIRGPIEGGLPTPDPLKETLRESVPFYYALRKSDSVRKYIDPILRSSYHQTDRVLFAAPYVADLMTPLRGKTNSVESDHGLIDSMIRPTAQKSHSIAGKIKLLFVGRVVRTKGVRDAIRAIGQQKNIESIEFTVIGDGDDLKMCRDEVEHLNLKDTVRILGWQSKDEVARYYEESDIFLFPSFREPTGGVLLEAMSYGLPVITCAYGGPDYFIDDTCGIRIPPQNEKAYALAIAEAIDHLCSDDTLRKKLGENAKLRSQEIFSWTKKRERITAIYCEVTGTNF